MHSPQLSGNSPSGLKLLSMLNIIALSLRSKYLAFLFCCCGWGVSLLFLGFTALDSGCSEQVGRGLLWSYLLELLVLRDHLRGKDRFIDVSQKRLRLAHALTELQIWDRVATELRSHVIDDSDGVFLECLHGWGVRFSHQNLHYGFDWRQSRKRKAHNVSWLIWNRVKQSIWEWILSKARLLTVRRSASVSKQDCWLNCRSCRDCTSEWYSVLLNLRFLGRVSERFPWTHWSRSKCRWRLRVARGCIARIRGRGRYAGRFLAHLVHLKRLEASWQFQWLSCEGSHCRPSRSSDDSQELL